MLELGFKFSLRLSLLLSFWCKAVSQTWKLHIFFVLVFAGAIL